MSRSFSWAEIFLIGYELNVTKCHYTFTYLKVLFYIGKYSDAESGDTPVCLNLKPKFLREESSYTETEQIQIQKQNFAVTSL